MPKVKNVEDLNKTLDTLTQRIDTLSADNAALVARIKDISFATKGHLLAPEKEKADYYRKFGAFAKAIIAMKIGSATTEQRDLVMEHRGTVEKADLGTPLTGDAVTGSYLVPAEYHDEIIRVSEDTSELMPLARKIPMGSRTKLYPTQGTGLTFTYIASDGGDLTEANPTFGQSTLTAYTYALWVGVTEALLEDDIVTLGEYLTTLAGEAWADKYDAEFLTGSGSPTTGLLNNASANISQMDAGSTTVDDIGVDDCYALVEDLTTAAKRRGAVFMMNPLVWDKVRKLKNADGDPIIAPWADEAAKRLFGYRVIWSDQLPSAPSSNTAFMAFGNPRHMLHGERTRMEMKFYDSTQFAITNTEVFFRFRIRAAFSIGVPAAMAVLKTGT